MRQWFALSAIGRDRPGIVADLAEVIYQCDGNLEDSSMTALGSEFAVLLLLSGTGPDFPTRLSTACKHLEWEKRLTVFLRPIDGDPARLGMPGGRGFECTITGVDRAGIVARVARVLADLGVSVTDLRTESRRVAESGTPLYTMRIRMLAPRAVGEAELKRGLDPVAVALRVELSLVTLPGE